MRLFCAKGSAPPVVSAARQYRDLTGRHVQVEVCGAACAKGDCADSDTHGFVHEVRAKPFDMAIAGSEADVDDLEQAGLVACGTRRSLWVREAAILVPQANPAAVSGLSDLHRPGVRIGISTIDCLRGVWEDVCGRAGCLREVGRNISVRVGGCMAIVRALAAAEVDAAFGWSSFAHLHPRIVVVPLPPEFTVYRATAASVLQGAADPEGAAAFIDFLLSDEGRDHFVRNGWRP